MSNRHRRLSRTHFFSAIASQGIGMLRKMDQLCCTILLLLAVVHSGCGGSNVGTNGTGGRVGSGGHEGTGGASGVAGTVGASGSGGSVALGSGGSVALGSGGSVALGSGGNVGVGGNAGFTGAGGLAGTGGTGGANGVAGASGAAGSSSVGTGGNGGGGAAGAGGRIGAGGAAGISGAGGSSLVVCGGLLGASCPSTQFCFYQHCTGAADQTGFCRTKPNQNCGSDYVPVCGCDGKTYPNMCKAYLADTSVAMDGECAPAPGSRICGGLMGTACASGEYCNFPLAAACGSADRTGVCIPIPAVCDISPGAVCGCDGKTYSNWCFAAVASTSVAYSGDCVIPAGHPCGGPTAGSLRCATNLYCKYSVGGCGAATAVGTCASRPTVCTTESAPVCGCNNQTYSNACLADGMGISVRSVGACPP